MKGKRLPGQSQLDYLWVNYGDFSVSSTTSEDPDVILTQGAINQLLREFKGIFSVYNYKGSVADYASLPTNAVKGDVYNVVAANGNIPAGTNYAWNGTEWDALGGSVDLSGYYTKTEVDLAIEDAKLTTELAQLTQKVNQNESKLLILNGEEDTAGSLKNTLKVAKDYTDTQLTNYVEKVEGSSLITNEKLQLIDTNSSNISQLETRVEANEAALTILKGDTNIEGSVLNTVNSALQWDEI